MLGHLFGHRTEEQSREFRVPSIPDDNEVHSMLVGMVDNLLSGVPHRYLEVRLDLLSRCGGLELRQQPLMEPARMFDHGLRFNVVRYFRWARHR